MKTLFLFAAVATLFAACSSKESLDSGQVENQKALAPGEIGFSAYTQRATTRAGQTGIMDLTALRGTSGFGVFGYYTDNNEYEQSRIPEFMYNQQVTWDDTENFWKYTPVKYWPNEYGNSANSDDNDKISFFAYAPYVEVQPTIGKVVKTVSTDDQWGITALSRNSASGDPLVKYIANFEADKRVDLMWGVCDDPNWTIVQGGTVQQINEGRTGLPWLNVERPMEAATQQAATTSRMKFTFKHALAQFSVNIDAFVDGLNATNALAANTKIYVRQISFTGFALKGALNLNNTDPNTALWLDYNGTADIESGTAVTIYDGRKDGKEGTSGADATNEKQRGLNPDIISNFDESSNTGNTTEGVTNVTKSLFATGVPAMVIPTGEDMEVEIVYDVETEDPNLSTTLSDGKTKGSSIENRIMKTVSFGSEGMQNGKHYTLSLHLGMNSVKFDADVSPWQEASDKPEADLPLNMPSFQASNSPVEQEITLTADQQQYKFAVYGLTPGETVTAEIVGTPAAGTVLNGKNLNIATIGDFSDAVASPSVVNSSGVAYIRINEDIVNNTVHKINKDCYISVKGGTSNKEVRISFEQIAHKLGLGVASVDNAGNGEIVLSSTATGLTWTSTADIATPDNSTSSSIIVKKNGTRLTYNPSPTLTTEFNWDATNNKIVIGATTASVAGDFYEITVKAGDANAETFVAHVGGIKLQSGTPSVTFRESPYTYSALAYTIYSNVTQTVTWTPTSGTNASVDGTTGAISTVQGGTESITASITATDDLDNGWYYTTATQSSSTTLTVNKQAAVGTFTQANIGSQAIAAGGAVTTLSATFKGALDTSANADGTVSYAVTDVKKAGVSVATTTFDITSGTANMIVGTTALDNNTTYTVTVTATKTAGAKYDTATKSVTFDITTAP